jgi:threonine 3-dehydrogenase
MNQLQSCRISELNKYLYRYFRRSMQTENILVTGAGGQIGQVLLQALAERFGSDQICATDIREIPSWSGPYQSLNVLDRDGLDQLVVQRGVTQIYHLAAILSATGEKDPLRTWQVNMDGFLNVMEVSRTRGVKRIFHPSSIAAFGAEINLELAGQHIPLIPATVYGISKVAGENWSYYYHQRYGLDVRSLRYPGIIGHQSDPGGGTTDYAVEIYHAAVKGEAFTCFLEPDTRLPMIYMDDAIRATLELMDAPAENIQVRTGYNLGGMDFTPAEIAEAIRTEIPGFRINYQPDFRQAIATSWPKRVDDRQAREDWGWKPGFDLMEMTRDMIRQLSQRLPISKH